MPARAGVWAKVFGVMQDPDLEWLILDSTVIRDGAPWHKAKFVRQTAVELGITLELLPGYSPDLNPIEGLWKWMREEVTQYSCHNTLRDLFDTGKSFIDEINLGRVDKGW